MKQDSEKESGQPEDRLMQKLMIGAGGTVVGAGIVGGILVPKYRMAVLFFLLTALIVVVVVGGIYLLLRARRKRGKSKGFREKLVELFDTQSRDSNDGELKAKLEEMKRKFMILIDRLKAEGNQDIYEMPWFLTIGPSGTGKSWVLKASGLEPLEDVNWKGGTSYIDWWSCSDALVLDTAVGWFLPRKIPTKHQSGNRCSGSFVNFDLSAPSTGFL